MENFEEQEIDHEEEQVDQVDQGDQVDVEEPLDTLDDDIELPIFVPPPPTSTPHMVETSREPAIEPPVEPVVESSESPVKPKRQRAPRKGVKTRTPKPKVPKAPRQRKPPQVAKESPETQAMRAELTRNILRLAEMNGSTDHEVKLEMAKAARIKPDHLEFALSRSNLKFSQSMTRNLASTVKRGSGLVLDTTVGGNGHVLKEFEQDKNLEASIHTELERWPLLSNPKVRILLSGVMNTVKGFLNKKEEQRKLANPQPTVSLENSK